MENIIPLRLKGDEVDMQQKKKIFIGSSTGSIKDMEMIARIIDDLGFEAMPWNKKGVFLAGRYTFDTLIKVSKEVAGAIFMFTAEDEVWYNDIRTSEKSVRDNVLLEYGLFVGSLGLEKAIFICKNNPKIATDLKGITYIDGAKTEYQIKPDLEAWLQTL